MARMVNRLTAVTVTKLNTPGLYFGGDGLLLKVAQGRNALTKSWVLRAAPPRRIGSVSERCSGTSKPSMSPCVRRALHHRRRRRRGRNSTPRRQSRFRTRSGSGGEIAFGSL